MLQTHIVVQQIQRRKVIRIVFSVRLTDVRVPINPIVTIRSRLLMTKAKRMAKFVTHNSRADAPTTESGKLRSTDATNVCNTAGRVVTFDLNEILVFRLSWLESHTGLGLVVFDCSGHLNALIVIEAGIECVGNACVWPGSVTVGVFWSYVLRKRETKN